MGLMDTFVILIASPRTAGLAHLANKIGRLTGGSCRWLAADEACEFALRTTDSDLEQRIRAELSGRPIDIAVLPAAYRRKRLLVADMDSTMISQECIDELAARAGVSERVSAITARAMRGELEFEASLRERLSHLAGLDVSVVHDLVAAIRYTSGGRTLVRTMQAHSAYTALVSGGFTNFSAAVGAALGFDEHRANELLIEGGKLIGLAREPVLGRNAKLGTLKELTQRLGLEREETLAVGDGANDIAMLEAAGLGVAFHAKPVVRERAAVRIDHADLTALLYLQGYAKEEFVN
jgi:phosphoserine phosphatase